jgi:F-type H+-transporting ATPase subunit gamma
MTLEQTRQRRQAVETIHDIVGAMRAIAAGRIQGAQRALASARQYRDVVLRGITALTVGRTEKMLPAAPSGPPMLVVMTSEQPLCGSFNQDVLAFAERRWQELRRAGPVHLVAVGQRGLRQMLARGLTPDEGEMAATSLHGLRDLVKRLAALADRRLAAGQLGALHVVFSRYQSVTEQVPTEECILPVDLRSLARPSVEVSSREHYRYLPLPSLLAGLVSEYAFISLYRAAAESFASEQASRLVAMDGATRNTERTLHELTDLERRERQDTITRQVLELIGARFAALE